MLPGSLLMHPECLGAAYNDATRCVLAVHRYGQPAPLEPILPLAQTHGLAVIEDCAQARGGTYDGQRVFVQHGESVHLMDTYRFLGHYSADLPRTECGAELVLSSPLYPGLTDADVEDVIGVVQAAA